MMDFINDLIEIGIGSVIDMSNHKVILEDEVYHKEMIKSYELEDKLDDSLSEEQKQIFEDYMDAVLAAKERACNLSYLLGAKKVMEVLNNTVKEDI